MNDRLQIVLETVKPWIIKFKSLNPIVRWTSYILGLLGFRKIYAFLYRKINNYPPGIYGLPFIGSISALTKDIDKQYQIKQSQIYKTVSMTYIGQVPAVRIHDYNIAKQVFVVDSNTKPYLIDKFSGWDDQKDAPFSELWGYEWKFRRQLTHKALTLLVDSKYLDNNGAKTMNTSLMANVCPTQFLGPNPNTLNAGFILNSLLFNQRRILN